MTFYSQDKQDQYLEENVFKGHKNGVFVDVGAHDGKTINNTLYYEETNNWTGINVEPILSVYKKLVVNRPTCINLNLAVDEKEGEAEFVHNIGHTEMISGLRSHYDARHHQRRDWENSHYDGLTKFIKVKTNTLQNIFADNNIKHVNYLSIDVEGAEMAVIKSIDFNRVFIDVIGFENNYKDTSVPIVDYLMKLGYRVLHSSMDIIMIHNKSEFNK